MAQVGVNNEPLHERLIFAYDGDDYRVVACDTDGNLVAAVLANQSIEVVQDTAADLLATVDIADDQNVQARAHGYVNADWQKDPIRFGYSDTVSEVKTNLNLAAGVNVLDGSAVPAGEIWVVTSLLTVYTGTVPTFVDLWVVVGGSSILVMRHQGPASSQGYDRQGWWVLEAGDYVRSLVAGATAGDDLELYYSGFTVDIDQ